MLVAFLMTFPYDFLGLPLLFRYNEARSVANLGSLFQHSLDMAERYQLFFLNDFV